MDVKPASGRRVHFSKVVGQVPLLLVGEGGRHALVFSNTGGADVRVGHSGSLSTLGMIIPAGQGFTDNYSTDDWWAVAASSSGTVSGFLVV
jgi:uncharacterized protein YjlB